MSFADERIALINRLTAVATMTGDIFRAFTDAGFQRDEALQLTLQFIDRVDSGWTDDDV